MMNTHGMKEDKIISKIISLGIMVAYFGFALDEL